MPTNPVVVVNKLDSTTTKLLDFHRRRITNAAPAINQHDYVILAQLKADIDPLQRALANLQVNQQASQLLLETNHVKNGSQSILDLVQGPDITIVDDGTGNVTISSTFGPSGEYDVAVDIEGTPAGGSVELFRFTFTEAVNFKANWTDSEGSVQTNPTGSQTWNVQKNGSNVGTVTISTGGVVGFTTSGGGTVQYSAGDVLRVIGSSSVDSTLSDVSVVFAGIRQVTGSVPIKVVTALWVQTLIPSSQIVGLYTMTSPVTFAANFSGSYGSCGTNPTGSATFTVYKNNVQIGTVVVSTLGVFTFSTSGGATETFVPGDVFKVTGPSVQDATLTNVGISFAAQGLGFIETLTLVMPSEFSVSGSPASGANPTITVTKSNENANIVFAGPSSGGAAAPTFRALVAADLPLATSSAFGAVKPDNTSITVSGGVISTAGVAASGLTLLEQHTASTSSELDFTSWYSSSYDDYLIEIVNLVPTTDNTEIILQFSTNGGSTYDSSAIYDKTEFRWGGGGTGGGLNDSNKTSISWPESTDGITNSASYGGLSGTYRLSSPGSSSIYKLLNGETVYTRTSSLIIVGQVVSGRYRNTTAVNAFKLTMTSGTIASGVVRVYGISK